jgi:hypothetical protein
MKASYAYPTDSLRSPTFTNKWGLASTLMDYTRYNYVAQPGDGDVRWVRMLGPYDSYAINWGYRFIPNATSAEAEKPTLNKWISEKAGDPVYLFGGRNSFDPSSQTESVGDDPIKASSYGLSNLKIVAKNLNKWTATEEEGYDDLEELYGELLGVWSRYCGHVVTNVGGVYEELLTTNEEGEVYTHLAKNEQQESVKWLNENVFSSPLWLIQSDIVKNISPSGTVEKIQKMQTRQLRNLLNKSRMERMVDNETLNGDAAYSLTDMLSDLRKGLWSDAQLGKTTDAYRRNVQRAHVIRLGQLMNEETTLRTDIQAAARAELNAIQRLAKSKRNSYRAGMDRYHLEDVVALIDELMEKD